MNISFSPEAEVDFASVVGYLAERNRVAATELGRRIFAMIDKPSRDEPAPGFRAESVRIPINSMNIYFIHLELRPEIQRLDALRSDFIGGYDLLAPDRVAIIRSPILSYRRAACLWRTLIRHLRQFGVRFYRNQSRT